MAERLPAKPWIALVRGYLLVTGLLGTLGMLLGLVSEHNLLWSVRLYFYGEYHWERPWAFADPARYLWINLTQLVLLVGGIALWQNPTRVLKVVWGMCLTLIVAATLSLLTALGQCRINPAAYPGTPVKLTMALQCISQYAVPVLAIWVAHRAARLRQPWLILLGGYLVIVGGLSSIALLALAFDQGDYGTAATLRAYAWAGLSWDSAPLAHYAYKHVASAGCVICGVGLLVSPKGARPVAWLVLVGTALNLIMEILLLVGEWIVLVPPNYLYPWVGSLGLGIYLVVFVHRQERPTSPFAPLCPRCGYSLRGLRPEGQRCPECGTTSGPKILANDQDGAEQRVRPAEERCVKGMCQHDFLDIGGGDS